MFGGEVENAAVRRQTLLIQLVLSVLLAVATPALCSGSGSGSGYYPLPVGAPPTTSHGLHSANNNMYSPAGGDGSGVVQGQAVQPRHPNGAGSGAGAIAGTQPSVTVALTASGYGPLPAGGVKPPTPASTAAPATTPLAGSGSGHSTTHAGPVVPGPILPHGSGHAALPFTVAPAATAAKVGTTADARVETSTHGSSLGSGVAATHTVLTSPSSTGSNGGGQEKITTSQPLNSSSDGPYATKSPVQHAPVHGELSATTMDNTKTASIATAKSVQDNDGGSGNSGESAGGSVSHSSLMIIIPTVAVVIVLLAVALLIVIKKNRTTAAKLAALNSQCPPASMDVTNVRYQKRKFSSNSSSTSSAAGGRPYASRSVDNTPPDDEKADYEYPTVTKEARRANSNGSKVSGGKMSVASTAQMLSVDSDGDQYSCTYASGSLAEARRCESTVSELPGTLEEDMYMMYGTSTGGYDSNAGSSFGNVKRTISDPAASQFQGKDRSQSVYSVYGDSPASSPVADAYHNRALVKSKQRYVSSPNKGMKFSRTNADQLTLDEDVIPTYGTTSTDRYSTGFDMSSKTASCAAASAAGKSDRYAASAAAGAKRRQSDSTLPTWKDIGKMHGGSHTFTQSISRHIAGLAEAIEANSGIESACSDMELNWSQGELSGDESPNLEAGRGNQRIIPSPLATHNASRSSSTTNIHSSPQQKLR
ncbi:uncharacterized protein LOC135821067 isoform X2 [Sycon ciliatum]|uniref:uncharacterized protein LOC135821067 isoform X2 n=1 Tax=Sycon ciliatum TaxID=27933 RepID=UPI0031F68A73